MSDHKLIGLNIAEVAKDPNDPMGQTLAKCPCVKALLAANAHLAKNTHPAFDKWLDNQDVMMMLHISLRSLQTLRSNGTLPYSRIRNKIFYRLKDIEKILNENYVSPQNTKSHDAEI